MKTIKTWYKRYNVMSNLSCTKIRLQYKRVYDHNGNYSCSVGMGLDHPEGSMTNNQDQMFLNFGEKEAAYGLHYVTFIDP